MAIADHNFSPMTRRWTRDEFQRAGELGIFGPEERLELLDGEIVFKMSPQSEPHAYAIQSLADLLRTAVGGVLSVREEKPIVLSDDSEPEPDIVVARRMRRHPRAADILLVVEVAVTSLAYDRTNKAAAYARAGIPDYWIVSLPDRWMEVRRDPGLIGPDTYGYRTCTIVLPGETVDLLGEPSASVTFEDVLPANYPMTLISGLADTSNAGE